MGLILLVEPGYENMEYQLIILVLTRTQLGIALDVSPISSTSDSFSGILGTCPAKASSANSKNMSFSPPARSVLPDDVRNYVRIHSA